MWHLSLRSRTSGLGIKKTSTELPTVQEGHQSFCLQARNPSAAHTWSFGWRFVNDATTFRRGEVLFLNLWVLIFRPVFFWGSQVGLPKIPMVVADHGELGGFGPSIGKTPKNPHPIFRGSQQRNPNPPINTSPDHGESPYPNFAKKTPRGSKPSALT